MSVLAVDPRQFPAGWRLKPLKAVADYLVSNVDKVPDEAEEPVRLCNYTDVYKNEFIRSSMEFMRSTATHREIEKFRLVEGDVVITKDSETWEDIAVPALVVESADDLVCGYHLAMLRPFKDDLDGRFLFRCLQSKAIRLALELASTGVTRFGLPKGEIGKLQLPIPPRSDQRLIADYLDTQTVEIDALVEEKKQMLVLLDEKRAALVTHASTRGLDPNAPLKPSGLEWLGDIPQHWRVMRFKHFARIGNGSTPNRENPKYWDDGDFPWLNSSVVGDRTVQEESRFVTEAALTECHLPKIAPPALLVAITGQGKTRGRSTVLKFDATINQHLAYVKPDAAAADCLYLSFVMDAAYAFIRSDSDGAGSTRGAITCEQLGNFRLPLPPLPEQKSILDSISARTMRFDSIEKSASASILLLKERRSALITAAVTGQIPIDEMTA